MSDTKSISNEDLIKELLHRMSQAGGETISIVELRRAGDISGTIITTASHSIVANSPCDEEGYYDLMDEGKTDVEAMNCIIRGHNFISESLAVDSVII